MSIPFRLLGRRAGQMSPWLRYYALARQILRRGRAAYGALTAAERTQLQTILRDSGGRPGRVSPSDRAVVQTLVRKALSGATHG